MVDLSWQEPYRAALAETDLRKLPARIEAARRAIHERLREIEGAGDTREHEQLDRALHALFTLAARKRTA
ncbi:MAG TPA: hypothetical protein VFB00_04015 [Terriglobales bacterium]|nr:hypothetical protein [Terriglobales bacterium]